MTENPASNQRKRGLGRGFDSLIPTQIIEEEFDVQAARDISGQRVMSDILVEVDPGLIDPNPHQPRRDFNEAALAELADSIKLHGMLQPVVATRNKDRYELIAGERRLRASKLAGLVTIPVIVRTYDQQQKLELALIENLQRADLNPIEMATAYRKLMDQFNLSNDELGQRVGRDRSTVANTMRLLNLPLEAKRAVVEGTISEGLARVILSVVDPGKQAELLRLMLKNNWTVRQAEEFARGFKGQSGNKTKAIERIRRTSELTRSLGDYLGTKVSQQHTAKGGKLIISYSNEDDLQRIYRSIRGE